MALSCHGTDPLLLKYILICRSLLLRFPELDHIAELKIMHNFGITSRS